MMAIRIFLLWITLFPLVIKAQDYEVNGLENCILEYPNDKIIIKNTDQALAWLKGHFNREFKFKNHVIGPYSSHFLFTQTFNNKEIYKSQVKINVDMNGNILSVSNNLISEAFKINEDASELKRKFSVKEKINNDLFILESTSIYIPFENKISPCNKLILSDFKDIYNEYILDTNGDLLFYNNLLSYFHKTIEITDTPAVGLIFNPDPLTSSDNVYLSPWVDSNDESNSQLSSQQQIANLICTFENDSFRLKNSAVVISEVSPPNVLPAVSHNPNFSYSRDQSGFEDVNAFFHITTFNSYIHNDLGFPNICNYQIVVDAHGMNGADNSNFNPASSPPRLSFGEGGVDDAEDADVIIHEYGHAISHSAAPNTNFGLERTTLDEAGGDYFAASYSRHISSNFWYNVYTWDGHNEFWNGRIANSTDHYPEDLANNKYSDADIWSSVLMEIWEIIGREATDRLLIQANMSYATNMTMPQAALLFLQADELLYNSSHFLPIRDKMVARGLLPFDISVPNLNNENLRLINSVAFFEGNGPLIIQTENGINSPIQIYNLEGKLILEKNSYRGKLELQPCELPKGLYLIKVGNNWNKFMR
jgi:hypothetical protein